MICESLYKIIPKKLIHKKIMYICITLKQFEVYLLQKWEIRNYIKALYKPSF